MITGQAVVLWSRLHLIVSGQRGDRILQWTKYMIITNVLILHVPTSIMAAGAQGTIRTTTFARGYNIIEKVMDACSHNQTINQSNNHILSRKKEKKGGSTVANFLHQVQMVGFFLQETILSSIYITETVHLLRSSSQAGGRQQRRTMQQLIAINVTIISMDLVLLGVEAASLYILQILLKGLVYSIKLKLEFAILTRLVSIVPDGSTGPLNFITSKDNMEVPIEEIVDFGKINSDITHAATPTMGPGGRLRRNSELDVEIARFEHVHHKGALWSESGAQQHVRYADDVGLEKV